MGIMEIRGTINLDGRYSQGRRTRAFKVTLV